MTWLGDKLSDWHLYLPFWLAVARWSIWFILRVIPSIFYTQLKVRNVRKLPNDSLCKVTYKDATVVVTAYQPEEDFLFTIESIIKTHPKFVLIAADKTCFDDPDFKSDYEALSTQQTTVKVLCVNEPGKRAALVAGIKATTTKIVVLADDDVRWSDQFLCKLIAPFQRFEKIGGVGCKQTGRIPHFFDPLRVMADMRLAVRFLELMATTRWDKGAACISGRTGAYRTHIIQNEKFYDYFLKEKFCGMRVISGDDKCLTRYIVNEGWDTYHQLRSSCQLSTSFKNGTDFFVQLLRWSRNTWRSDITNLFIERKIWRHHPVTAIILLDKMFTPFFILFGLIFFVTTTLLKGDYYLFIVWAIWLFATRCVKLCYYLMEKPKYILYIPLFIIFQYIQSIIKLYALVTVSERGWGTRSIAMKGNEVVRSDGNTKENEPDDIEKGVNKSKEKQTIENAEPVAINNEKVEIVINPIVEPIVEDKERIDRGIPPPIRNQNSLLVVGEHKFVLPVEVVPATKDDNKEEIPKKNITKERTTSPTKSNKSPKRASSPRSRSEKSDKSDKSSRRRNHISSWSDSKKPDINVKNG